MKDDRRSTFKKNQLFVCKKTKAGAETSYLFVKKQKRERRLKSSSLSKSPFFYGRCRYKKIVVGVVGRLRPLGHHGRFCDHLLPGN